MSRLAGGLSLRAAGCCLACVESLHARSVHGMNDVASGSGVSAGGLRGVLALVAALHAARTPFALALVVRTHGSTYRKPGALAVVGADGRRAGVLSGGCLEPEVDRVARAALAAGRPALAQLDTATDDDLLFGSGSGCRGTMELLLIPQAPPEDGVATTLLDALGGGNTAHVSWTGAASEVARVSVEPLASGTSVAIRPPPRLILFGAGPEAPALTRIARELGWLVEVADHRPALCDPLRLPAADRCRVARPAAALAERGDARLDAALVMTHVASADLEALRALAPLPVAFVGLLGPRARREELMAQLTPAERTALSPRLHGPAGLDLGGEGPEAIALSIAAGLLRQFQRQP